ncbi:Peptide chain release factor 3 [Candidatus Arthromitus sp. SFB-mouse-NL]|uniref:peptide chain release factor 3 n=1 Tax=Candidatus Arthromitus sp. SFB-mouse-NL TaxID=1508644 RepID=UPI00049A8878|nr:peptide chain release factor 3 [Candidatus Arthromitus sp. SFB-mouse-NL]AID45308.1 Peptide chain release factor 3 [Candidatus Arthromitus sp. SFB-mouse-NL]
MNNFIDEIKKRRTFGIISHPDAGKTTLTEKLLLYSGAIRLAGSVKARKSSKHATSDWMDIEKQRGISVTSSVLQFNYDGFCINILDTPGHEDFSEDTYRTLVACDSAVMVIDGSKGIELQTKKLFHVCAILNIPIFTFINKVDREIKNPFDLIEEIEQELGINCYPMNWPIGCGDNFKGIYQRDEEKIYTFLNKNHGQDIIDSYDGNYKEEIFKDILGEQLHKTLIEDIDLLNILDTPFDHDKILEGKITPVFFGSAITNFGVEIFLKNFLKYSSIPIKRESTIGYISPFEDYFSAFVFKIQANMNPKHRDRIAFMRICSGKFQKGMEVSHIQNNNKIKLSQPQQFFAQEKELIDEAYAGDIIGVFDPGIFSIGDTLTTSKTQFKFNGMPSFSPELFATIKPTNSMKRKQFLKGVTQIAQEGAIQVFREFNFRMEEVIIGVIGNLQFEVLEYRLKHEYNTDIKINKIPYSFIRWIEKSDVPVDNLNLTNDTKKAIDLKGRNILIFQNNWEIQWALDKNPSIILSDIGKFQD